MRTASQAALAHGPPPGRRHHDAAVLIWRADSEVRSRLGKGGLEEGVEWRMEAAPNFAGIAVPELGSALCHLQHVMRRSRILVSPGLVPAGSEPPNSAQRRQTHGAGGTDFISQSPEADSGRMMFAPLLLYSSIHCRCGYVHRQPESAANAAVLWGAPGDGARPKPWPVT